MKILFISSGNNNFGVSPVVKAQGASLKKVGVELEYFTVVGKGISGYTKNIFKLRKHIKTNSFDLVHSHFFLSAVGSTLSNPQNLVVSLMGSDVYTSLIWNFLIKLFHKRWDATIVKSERMKDVLGLEKLYVIPNGVDMEKFYPMDKEDARKKLGWENKKYVLFASGTKRPEKNYQLALEVMKMLNEKEAELVTLQDIPHEEIVYYLNATDLLLMTSKYEGSPNIIKEAMACNCPIVSTDVGDVKEIIGNTAVCFITSVDPDDVAEKIKGALEFGKRTKGRERIIELGLDSKTVAKKIIRVYQNVLNGN